MSLARHHRLRIMAGLTPRQEYALGVLEEEGEIKTSHFPNLGITHDGLKSLLERLRNLGYVQFRWVNKKMRMVSLTDLGREYIQQVREIYGREKVLHSMSEE